MDRRLGLVALWAVFAVASVGVGFGAAGLVGDPFSDPADDRISLSTGGRPSGSGSASPSSLSPSSSATSSGSPSTSAGSGGPPAEPVVRTLTTRAGLVSGSCSRDLVTVSASPLVGWSIDDVDGGPDDDARVRFERADDGDGRVEVRARCDGGVPRFTVEDDSSGHGGGHGDDD